MFAIPAAWLCERTDLPGRRALSKLLTIPYAIPSFLMAIAWITIANPSVGWINLLAGRTNESALVNLYTLGGIVFVETSCLFAILFLSFSSGLQKLDPAFEEAACLAGAGKARTFFKITLPLLKGPLFAGLLSVALGAAASFGVPAMIGVPARRFVLTTGIYSLIKEGSSQSFNQALGVAGLLALVALAAVVAIHKLGGRQESVVSGKASRATLVPLGALRWPLSLFLWLQVGLLLVLPAATLLASSFQLQPGSLRWEDFGPRVWNTVLFEMPDLRDAAWNSLITAGAATLLILTASLFASAMLPRRARERLEAASLLIFSLPGTVIALLLIVLTAKIPGGRILSNGLGILVVAYVLKYFALGLRTVASGRDLIHPSLNEAALLAGAGPWTRLRRIWLPLLKTALAVSALLCFAPCLTELTMSILLYGPGTETTGVLLFQLQDYADRTGAAVVGTLALGAVLILQALLARIDRRTA